MIWLKIWVIWVMIWAIGCLMIWLINCVMQMRVCNYLPRVLERALYFSAARLLPGRPTDQNQLVQITCLCLQKICRKRLVVMHAIRTAALLLIFKLVFVLTAYTRPTLTFFLNIILPSCTKRGFKVSDAHWNAHTARNSILITNYTSIHYSTSKCSQLLSAANLIEDELEHF